VTEKKEQLEQEASTGRFLFTIGYLQFFENIEGRQEPRLEASCFWQLGKIQKLSDLMKDTEPGGA